MPNLFKQHLRLKRPCATTAPFVGLAVGIMLAMIVHGRALIEKDHPDWS